MKDLKILTKQLTEKVSKLEEEIQSLIAVNGELRNEINNLKEENGKLKERLGLTSQNSSIPSSKELYKIKKETQKSERKIGAQPGHPYKRREKMVADEVVNIAIETTCECGGDVSISKQPYIHQKVDIPEIKPYVTEYQLQHGRCKKCRKRKTAQLPTTVAPDMFGPRVKAIISSLTGFYKNSKREVENVLQDIFNLDISIGSISNSEARVAEKCQEQYEIIEEQVSTSKVVHIDETSHYQQDKRGWCWVFSSSIGTLLRLTDSRGKKVLEASSLGPNDNIIVTDRYAAYNYFAEENRQICWAHLARDFERLANSCHQEVQMSGLRLKQLTSELFGFRVAWSNKKIDILRFLRRAKKIRKRMRYCFKQMLGIEDAIRARRVAKNMLKAENMMWKFLDDPVNIPLTNNHAERQIRHYVVYRKNSYFTQSERGNRFLERVISLYLTYKQQNLNPFTNLLQIVT